MPHRHRAASVSLRGKADSFTVECSCGYGTAVGTWWDDEAPKGWAKRPWPKTMEAGRALLAAAGTR